MPQLTKVTQLTQAGLQNTENTYLSSTHHDTRIVKGNTCLEIHGIVLHKMRSVDNVLLKI